MMRRALALAALIAGALAAVSGSPYRRERARIDVASLAREVALEKDHISAIELAQWIRDRKPGLRVVDLRSAQERAEFRVPRSENMTMDGLLALPVRDSETLVLISGGGAHAAQAWVLLRALGHRRVYFLRGGVFEWIDEIMQPAHPTDLTRYFGGMPRMSDPGVVNERDTNAAMTAAMTALRRRGC